MEYELTTVEPTTQNVKPTIMDKSLGTNLHYICGAFFKRAKQIHLHLFIPSPSPSPPPLLQCQTRVHAISPEFQHCIGAGGQQRILRRITVPFVKFCFKNTEN